MVIYRKTLKGLFVMIKSFLFSLCLLAGSFLSAQPAEPVVVLGGGVGGLTSALYLSRAGYQPIIIEGQTPGGLITQSPLVENWPGEKRISGQELTDNIRSQVVASGGKFLTAEIKKIDFSQNPLQITIKYLDGTQKEQTISASSAIVALGSSPRFLGVAGEKYYWGKGLSHCALCDGNLYQGKTVAVVGGKESAITEALYLSKIAKKVLIIFRKDALNSHEENSLKQISDAKNIQLIPHTNIAAIEGNPEQVENLLLKDAHTGKVSQKLPIDGVFLAIGSDPNTELFNGQLKLTKDGKISLAGGQQSSNEAVFAAGDISSMFKQAIIASGEGATAAIQVMDYLKKKGVDAVQESSVAEKQDVLPTKFEILDISSTKEFQKVLSESTVPVLIDFYATWCGPCKRLSPILEEQGRKLVGKVRILKVNVDKNASLAKEYQIRSMPSLIVYAPKKGVLQKRTGTQSIAELLSDLVSRKDQTDADLCAYLESSVGGNSFLKAISK